MGGMGGLRITTFSTVLLFVTSTLAADGDARIHQNGGTTSTGVVASEGAREMSARHDGAAVIKPGQTYVGKQGFTYGAGASAGTVGAQKVCMNVLPMPPGAVAKAHYHKGIETIAYMLEGECAVYYGDDLQKRLLVQQGEQCFVAADVPHAPRNESGKPCVFIVVHSSGSDQDEVVLLPELDVKLAARMPATA